MARMHWIAVVFWWRAVESSLVSLSVAELAGEVLAKGDDIEAAATAWCAERMIADGECASRVAAEVVAWKPDVSGRHAPRLAQALLTARRPKDAAKVLEQHCDENPCCDPLLMEALFRAQRHRRALAVWRNCSSSKDLDLEAAQAARAVGDTSTALAMARGLKNELLVAEIKAELGQAFDKELDAALALDTNSETLRQAGLLRLDFGKDPGGALPLLRSALELDPTNLGAHHGIDRAEAMMLLHPRVHVVTFGTDASECGLRRLLRSARTFHVEVIVLGLGTHPWSNGQKLTLLRDHAVTLPGSDLLLAVDGYDVVVAGDIDTRKIMTNFLLDDENVVVFSADQTFYFVGDDEPCYGRHYPGAKRAPYRFLNSGSLVGRAKDVAALVDAALTDVAPLTNWNGHSDQTLFHRIFVEQVFLTHLGLPSPCGAWSRNLTSSIPRIRLDTTQILFGNTGGRAFLRDFTVLPNGRLHNKVTDTFPMVLHAPGERRHRSEFDRLSNLGWNANVLFCDD